MAHIHSIYDTDPHFVIDPITRRIKNESGKVVLVQGDHNSERFTFEIPRYVDGHDMSLCDVVEVHYNNVGSSAEETYSDVEEIGDLQISPASNDVVIFSWLISGNATQYKGALNFAVSFQCHDSEGNIDYELGTLTHEGITIGERIRNSKSVIERVADILSKWRNDLFGIGKTEEAKMRAVSQEEQNAIAAKGADVLATIPVDYTATSTMAEEAVRTKANGIVLSAEGEPIALNDSSDGYIRGLKLFGKSTQKTTTGAQLANLPDAEVELGGITWSCKNGVVTAVGTCNAESSSTGNVIMHNLTGLTGTFHVSGNSNPAKVYVRTKKNGTEKWYNDITFTLDGTEEDVLFYMQVANVGTVVNTTLYPMLNAGDKALPWEPYTGGKPAPNSDYPQEINSTTPTIKVLTSNLLDTSALDRRACTSLEVSEDGYTVSLVGGTYAPYVSARCSLSDAVVSSIRGQTVVFKMDSIESTQPDAFPGPQITLYEGDRPAMYYTLTKDVLETTFVVPEATSKIELGAYVNNVARVLETDNVVTIRGITMHTGEHNWEPYLDQSLAVSKPIPGISVASGGNHVDLNGKKWVCNEIDFERGVYIKRVEEYTVTGIPAFNETADQLGRFSWFCLPEYFATGRNECLLNFAKWRSWGISDYLGVNDYGGVSGAQLYYSPAVTMTAEEVNAKFAEMIASGNPPRIVAQLTTPIETPLTAEEIAAFKALRTNYPNTTILNDAGAWMSVRYNADTKTYIDNQIAKRIAEITNT